MADAVAEQLRAAGVVAGDVVGVASGRSVTAPVLILGVMTAGAVYLPLDPLYPDALLTHMATAAGVQTIVVDQSAGGRLPEVASRVVSALTLLAAKRGGRTRPAVRPCDAAYAMFTSGSTGSPKGVLLGHAGLAQYAQALPARIGMEAGDRCVGAAPLGFSSSIRQLLLPLACGATVVLPSEEQLRTPWQLMALIQGQRVSHLDVTPSYWQALLDALPTDELRVALAAVRRVLFASERLDPQLAQRTRQLASQARIWNMYGCTETTGIVAAYEVTGGEPREMPVPIGAGLDHVSVSVDPDTAADSRPGWGGQIIVTGPAVALGYLGAGSADPPCAVGCAVRRLATGDRAEPAGAGGLVWTGRADRLLKVRGMRVSPETVEHQLLACDGVGRAAVVAATDRGVVCVVEAAGGSSPPDPRRLTASLRSQLPGHLVPASISVTFDWPVLPNGKSDFPTLIARFGPRSAIPTDTE